MQSKVLREKLAELEKEIEKFRSENVNLDKLRKEREEVITFNKKLRRLGLFHSMNVEE